MKFLFTAPGFPGVQGTTAGSGVGRYLYGLTAGLQKLGHTCHVLAWGDDGAPSPQLVNGATVHLMPHRYWRVVERFLPESCDVYRRWARVRELDARHGYDWIECQNDEGIEVGVQWWFRPRAILRVHTTLAQTVCAKRVPVTRRTRFYLARERQSLRSASHILASSASHAEELRRLFPFIAPPRVVHLGVALAAGPDPAPAGPDRVGKPTFLVVGSADRRKGFDRLRPVLETYVRNHGPCRLHVVAACRPGVAEAYGLTPPFPAGLDVVWRSDLTDPELVREYAGAAAYLHLARYESFGYTPVEAAACGTPVVATRTGIAEELLTGDLARFLVDGDDPAACAAALAEAAAARDSVGRALQAHYENHFTEEQMVRSYLRQLEAWRSAGPEAN